LKVERVRRKQGIGLAEAIVAIAAPSVLGGVVDERRAHRIEFDIALAKQEMRFRLDGRRLVATVPQGAAAAVGLVDVLHVTPAQCDDDTGDADGCLRRQEQMHVIGHQGIGMQLRSLAPQRLAQPVQVGVAILFRKEASLAVVAALNQVQRHTVEVEAGATRHRAEYRSFLREMRAWPLLPLLSYAL